MGLRILRETPLHLRWTVTFAWIVTEVDFFSRNLTATC
jgi:hypothetical protein